MKDCRIDYTEISKLDPNKRVNYVHGLVLGVDEFLQEEFYLLEKHRRHNRLLHGYGTVCGLAVELDDTDNGPQVMVRSGMAINPRGEEIRVPSDQCAWLNEWLLQHGSEVTEAMGSPPSGPLSLYLVLCYRECKTDFIPIPSGPCQSLEETSAASRIADHFALQLTTSKPQQVEDETIKDLFDLLDRIEITDTEPGMTRQELEDLVRGINQPVSPPLSPPVTSPPGAGLTLHPANARDYLRSAFKVWVTEVKPKLLEADRNCASGPPREKCVLLTKLAFDVNLSELGFSVSGNVALDESQRPFLLSTYFLQERLLTPITAGTGGGVTSHSALSDLATGDDHPQYLNQARGDAHYSPLAHTHILDGLTDVDATPAADTNVLTFEGGIWVPRQMDHGALGDLEDDDHPQYHTDSRGDARYSLLAHTHNLDSLDDVNAGSASNNNVLTFEGGTWVPRQMDHGALGGRADDDHTQYHNNSRGDARYYRRNVADQRFVQGAAGPYMIVAAGRFDIGGNPRGPVYNKLKAAPLSGPGVFSMDFPGYRNPDSPGSQHTYIIKGITEHEKEGGIVHLVQFLQTLFHIRVTGSEVGFMVEISLFGKT